MIQGKVIKPPHRPGPHKKEPDISQKPPPSASEMSENTVRPLEDAGYYWDYPGRQMIYFKSPLRPPTDDRFRPKERRSDALSLLESLPFEIIYMVFNNLDFQSLEVLRRLSFRTREVVHSFPAHQDMTARAPDVLRALSHIGIISHFTAARLSGALYADRCVVCNDFGPYLFLLTLSRCCLNCLDNDLRLRVTTIPEAMTCYGLTKNDLRSLLTGQDLSRPDERKGVRYVSADDARALGIATHGSAEAMDHFSRAEFERKTVEYESGRRATKPRSLALNSHDPRDRNQYDVSTAFPYFDPGSKRVELGIWCKGCKDRRPGYGDVDKAEQRTKLQKAKDKAFSEAEFLKHYEECEFAKKPDDFWMRLKLL